MVSTVAVVIGVLEAALSSPPSYSKLGPPPVGRGVNFTANTLPQLLVRIITVQDMEDLVGAIGMQECIVQVDSMHVDQDVADGLRTEVKDVLLTTTGVMLGRNIQGANHVVDVDLYLDETKLWQCSTRIKMFIETDPYGAAEVLPYDPNENLELPLP